MAKLAEEVGSTANRYQILGRIAVGGMAEIFLARGANATGFERYCVLKVLRMGANRGRVVGPAAPVRSTPPPPVHSAPASNASGITTAKWRPTKELALRVAPRLFTVIIPAATVGAILAWLVTHDKPRAAPTAHADHAPAATETSPPPATEAPPAGAPGEEKADAGVAPGADSPAPAPASRPDTETDGHRLPYDRSEPRTSDRSPSKPNAPAHTATKPRSADNDPYAQIKLMHEQRNYPAVVRACHAFIARSDVAPACFDAACHQQNIDEARRWLASLPARSRNVLIAACKQIGNIDVSLAVPSPSSGAP